MKARVKATGEIVEIDQCSILYNDEKREIVYGNEVEEIPSETSKMYDELDEVYWANLKHQYAGMAMNALLLTNNIRNGDLEGMRECNTNAMAIAHALVEKLKEEK